MMIYYSNTCELQQKLTFVKETNITSDSLADTRFHVRMTENIEAVPGWIFGSSHLGGDGFVR